MPLRIEPVRTSKDLHEFVTLPWRIYRDDPVWVPPLIGETKKIFRPETNPFFQHGEIVPYLARRDEDIVGRIAAIRNLAHEEFQGESVGFFGFFECENDPEAATGLLGTVREFLRSRRLRCIRGPVNPSTNDDCGILVEGFEHPPMVMMAHSKPYYDSLIEQGGLSKAKDLYAYYLESDRVPEDLEKLSALVRKRLKGLTIRPVEVKHLSREVEIFKTIYNQAWERNWGFVPMTDAEIDHMAKQLKPVIDPALIQMAELDGRPIAIALGLPDVNQAVRHADGRLFPLGLIKILWYARRIKRMRLLALGILPEFRRSGVDGLLYYEIYKSGLAKGYRAGEFSWILEDNLAIQKPIQRLGARRYKTYRLYEAPVDAEP